MIEKDFGARSAGAGIAHAPEIIRGRNADDLFFGQTRNFAPQVGGFFILGIDRRKQLFFGQAVALGQKVPGKFDRIGLEIIAEGEIAEHFEKGQMAGGVAHIVQIVMLAARANNLLGCRGAGIGTGFLPGEHVLERYHASIGEEQGRIVLRHERGRGNDLVAMVSEILQKRAAQLICGGVMDRSGHGASRKSRLRREDGISTRAKRPQRKCFARAPSGFQIVIGRIDVQIDGHLSQFHGCLRHFCAENKLA